MDPYSDMDPFLNTSFIKNDPFDTSSLIKCRKSTFLISMKSPSLQILPRSIKRPIIRLLDPKDNGSSNKQLPRFDSSKPCLETSSLEVSRLRSLIFTEDKEIEYQRILQAKNQELQTLKAEMKKRLNISQISNNEKQAIRSENHEEALILLRQSMKYAVEKCQNTYKTLQARNGQFLELISAMETMRKTGIRESEILQLKTLFAMFSTNIEENSIQSLELAEALKLLQEKNLENINLSSRMEKLNIRCEYFQSRFQESQVRNSLFSEELKSKNKNLHVEENKTSEQGKRLFVLNKLVKALKSKGNRQEDQNNYKMVINELVKEIEVFKRAITNKDKEIAHLREINEKMKAKIASFTKRIEILQMNLSQKKPEDEGIGSQDAEIENEAFSLLKEMRIPPMLDYRSSNLSALLTNLFMDIENQGPEALLLHLREEASNPEDRVSIISTMASQYVSYHEFAESLNSLLFHLIKMMSFSTFQEVLSYFSGSLKKVFNCEEARIWLDDKMTGILMTYSEKGMALKAMSGRGLLGKSMDSLQALNKITEKNLFLCEILTENDLKKSIVDGVLLVPLEPNIQKTRAILEFSGFHGSCDKSHSLDYEYFAILARAVLGDILAKINQKVLNSQESKLQDFFQMALIDLCTSESDYQFSEKIKNWVSRLFNVSISNFYFYTNELLIKHFTASNFEEIGEIGVVGKCSKGLKPLLTPNLKNSPHFDGKVDLSTLMTVLTFPIIEKNTLGEKKCLGVIQIPIKESAFMGKNMEFGEVRPDLEKLGQFFGEITELALRYYRRSWG